jgi:hypothetical protein
MQCRMEAPRPPVSSSAASSNCCRSSQPTDLLHNKSGRAIICSSQWQESADQIPRSRSACKSAALRHRRRPARQSVLAVVVVLVVCGVVCGVGGFAHGFTRNTAPPQTPRRWWLPPRTLRPGCPPTAAARGVAAAQPRAGDRPWHARHTGVSTYSIQSTPSMSTYSGKCAEGVFSETTLRVAKRATRESIEGASAGSLHSGKSKAEVLRKAF